MSNSFPTHFPAFLCVKQLPTSMWLPSSFLTRLPAFPPAFQLSYTSNSFPTHFSAFLPVKQLSYVAVAAFQLSYPPSTFLPPSYPSNSFPTSSRCLPASYPPSSFPPFPLAVLPPFQLPTPLPPFLHVKQLSHVAVAAF